MNTLRRIADALERIAAALEKDRVGSTLGFSFGDDRPIAGEAAVPPERTARRSWG
jgi:hypothetical protein